MGGASMLERVNASLQDHYEVQRQIKQTGVSGEAPVSRLASHPFGSSRLSSPSA